MAGGAELAPAATTNSTHVPLRPPAAAAAFIT